MKNFGILSLLASPALAGFGASWWWNPSSQSLPNGVHIVSTKTTLKVPDAPHPQVDRLALWPGMETTGGGLVQSIIVSFANPAGAPPEGCYGTAGQWCAFASLFDNGGQQSGHYVPVSPGDMLDIDYHYDASTGAIVQKVSLDGKQISTFSSKTGSPTYYTCQVECEANESGTMPAQTYYNTEIVFSGAYTGFPNDIARTASTDSGPSSPDGGKTWSIAEINIEAYQCNP